jgi:hypothetical protein
MLNKNLPWQILLTLGVIFLILGLVILSLAAKLEGYVITFFVLFAGIYFASAALGAKRAKPLQMNVQAGAQIVLTRVLCIIAFALFVILPSYYAIKDLRDIRRDGILVEGTIEQVDNEINPAKLIFGSYIIRYPIDNDQTNSPMFTRHPLDIVYRHDWQAQQKVPITYEKGDYNNAKFRSFPEEVAIIIIPYIVGIIFLIYIAKLAEGAIKE